MASVLTGLLLIGALQVTAASSASASVTTNGNDVSRSGWYPDEPGLSPSLVGSSGFGQKFAATVDGQVYAQPLVANGTLLVATETNKVYGLNPATGAQLWSRSDLGVPFNPADVGCADLTPSIGITGTPVVDEATHSMYFLSKSYASGSSGTPIWRMYAVDTLTGANKPNFPVVISGNADNDPGRAFDPKHQMQRPGLLLMGGVVYAGFGAHCIALPYNGWVVGIDAASGAKKAMWSTQVGAGNQAGGIWQSGSGLVSDGNGQILFATGNGSTPSGPVPGHTPPGQLGLSVVRLTVQPNGTLKPTDFFAPYDSQVLDSGDMDLGSGGPVALPAQFGTAEHPHLMVEAGKQGYVYLLDRDNLGGKGQGPSGGDGVVGRFGPDGGVWGKPTAWPGDGGWIYVTTVSAGTSAEAHTGELHAYKYGLTGAGQPTMTLAGRSADYFGLSSSPPVVTSDGTTSGSALIWVVYAAGFDGQNAQLRAYLPVPDADGNMVLVNSWPIGTSSKFNQPSVDGGLVYVGTRDGKVLAFGQTVTVPMSATPATWDPVPVGQASVKTVTLTANTALKVSAISSTDSHFTVGSASPAIGTSVAAGSTVQVPVTFTPTATGQVSGTLQVTTPVGVVKVALSGIGQSATAELTVAPSSISFGGVPVGETATRSVTFANTGATTLTVTGATAPAAPFVITGTDLPKTGQTVAPGASVIVPVTFAPSAVGGFTGTLAVRTSGGTISVPLSGSAALAAKLTLSDQTVDFGPVPVGSTVTQKFTLSNTGGLPLSLTRSKPPVSGQGFTATVGIGEGETLQPGETRTLTVQFAPTAAGAKTDQWQFNGGAGIQTVTFTGTGMAAGTVPAPTATNGWVFNQTAKMVGSSLELTGATETNAAATAFWPVSVDSRFLDVSFDASMGGGSGADGLTLILGDSTHLTQNSVGAPGGGLGFGGLTGVAVGLDTYRNGDDPSDNFVGVATTKVNDPVNLLWAATTTSAPQLRGTAPLVHRVRALVTQGTLTVFLDGKQVLTTPVTLSPRTLLGFGAASGGLTDQHSVANVVVKSIGSGLPGSVTVSPAAVDLGQVPVGTSLAGTFTVGNPGDTAVTLTASVPPKAGKGFTAVTALPVGTVLPPGSSRAVAVNFTPAAGGAASDSWSFASSGGGTAKVTFTGTGRRGGTVPAPTATGWQLNSPATMVGSTLQLTGTAEQDAGSTAFWKTPVESSYLDASFDVTLGGGSGADGLSFILADPAQTTPTSVGAQGGGLGFGGLTGVAVAFDTYRNGNDPSDNFVGIATTTVDDPVNLLWAATTASAPLLRGAAPVTRHARVLVANHTLAVFLDGTQVLSTPVSLSARSLIGFGAGSGLLTDQHAVSKVVIKTVVPAVAPGAPTGVSALAHQGAATVAWTAPADDGGSPVTAYRVTATPGGASVTVGAGARSATLSGLTNGTAYRFSVVAGTAVGSSVPSTSSGAVTPLAAVAVPVGVYVSDAVLARPASGSATMNFTVSLSAASASTAYVRYQTADGTAKAGLDYRAVPSSVMAFAPGQTSRVVPVTVLGRALHGAGSSDLHLRVTSVSAGLIGVDADGIGRLLASQGPVVVSVKDVVVQQGPAASSAVFTLSLSAAPVAGETVSVVIATVNGSATAADYAGLAARTVTFGAGLRSVNVSVPVKAGVAKVANRTFLLKLSAPSANAVLARPSATATLRRAGSPAVPVGAYVSDAASAQPRSGAAVMNFTVSLSAAPVSTVSVRVQTVDGTARAGIDYRAVPSSVLTFAAGQTSRTVPVTVLGSGRHSVAMTGVHLRVTAATGVAVLDNDGVGRLMGGQGPVSLSVKDVVVNQSATATAAVFTLSLSAAPAAGETVSVVVATATGSSVSPTDYTALAARTVTFGAGVRAVSVAVPVKASVGARPNRTFSLVLSGPSSVIALSRPAALATLVSH